MAIVSMSSPTVINDDFRSYSITFMLQFHTVFPDAPRDLNAFQEDCWPVTGTKLYEMLTWTSLPRLLLRNPFRQPRSIYNLNPVETDLNTAIVLHQQLRSEGCSLAMLTRDKLSSNSKNRLLVLEHTGLNDDNVVHNAIKAAPARKWSLKAPIAIPLFSSVCNQDQTVSAAEMAITSILKMMQKLGKTSRSCGVSSSLLHNCRRESNDKVAAQMTAAEESFV